MRVNIYAEEMTNPRVEIVTKGEFTGVRFYLELPVTRPVIDRDGKQIGNTHVQGPFMHHVGDDDSAAVTFWGKRDLRDFLLLALNELDNYYGAA